LSGDYQVEAERLSSLPKGFYPSGQKNFVSAVTNSHRLPLISVSVAGKSNFEKKAETEMFVRERGFVRPTIQEWPVQFDTVVLSDMLGGSFSL
jgi:hypothetical protein